MSGEMLLGSVPQLLRGVPLTLELTALSVAVGLVLAIGLAACRSSRFLALRGLSGGYLFVFRGTPLLVQLFLLYYGLSQFSSVRASVFWVALRDPFWCSALALALNTAAYASEIIRGGVLSVPAGHLEAARAVGMSRMTILRRVVVPMVARQALPAYGNELILMIKATSLASTVTLLEITGIARQIISRSYAVFEVFIAAGMLYLLLNMATVAGVHWLENRLHPDRRRARPTNPLILNKPVHREA